jgi:hypothetical protein
LKLINEVRSNIVQQTTNIRCAKVQDGAQLFSVRHSVAQICRIYTAKRQDAQSKPASAPQQVNEDWRHKMELHVHRQLVCVCQALQHRSDELKPQAPK